MLRTGKLDPSWHKTLFSMLPKKGDLADAGNWRPIAILRVTYKLFSRLLYGRVKEQLNMEQSSDQVGFRQCRSIDDAFIVLETMISKHLEYNLPLYMASLDLRKAFARIEYGALFEALRQQGIADDYLSLFVAIYSGQSGHVRNSRKFSITRGVKQGDILSPFLFNAALKW